MIKVRTLGAAEIVIGKKRITPKSEVMFALAVYLCLRAGERVPRDPVAEMFWPKSDPEKAKHSLRQMLYRMRQAGFQTDESRDALYLAKSFVDADVWSFLSAHENEALPLVPPAEEPVFLGYLSKDLPEGVRDWFDVMRARVASHARAGAAARMKSAKREGRWRHMQQWAELILKSDPFNTHAITARSEAHAILGSKTLALSLVEDFERDAGDAAESPTFSASKLKQRIFEMPPEWGRRSGKDTALVGRQFVMSQLSDYLDGASHGRGAAIALVGAGGIGKTRLAQEAQAVATLQGFRCVSLRADGAQGHRPLALTVHLAEALRTLPGANRSPALSIPILNRLTQQTDDPTAALADGHGDIPAAQIQWALAAVAAAVTAEQKLFLVLEDAHHIDAESWTSLATLLENASTHSLLLVVTGRSLPHLASKQQSLVRITVPPLAPEDSLLLAEQLATQSQLRSHVRPLKQIALASGGNPLFIRELVSHVPAHRNEKLPPSLQHVIDRRLGTLPPSHIRILRIVSLFGELSTLARVQSVASMPAMELSNALDDLERDGIVSLTSAGIVMVHECWRTAIVDSTSSTSRASLGLECAQALEKDTQSHDQLDRLWLAAELFARANDLQSARTQLIAAGRVLLARGIASQASEAFSRALSLKPSSEETVVIMERIAWSECQAGHAVASISAAREGLSLLHTVGRPMRSLHVQLLATLADSLWRAGQEHAATLDEIEQFIVHDDVDDSVRHYAALIAVRLIYINSAEPRAAKFIDIVESANRRTGPTLQGELARLIHASESGDDHNLSTIASSLDELISLPQPPLLVVTSFRYRAAAFRFVGATREAEEAALKAAHLAEHLGQPEELISAMHALVFLYLDNGDLSSARSWLDQATRHEGPATTPASRMSALQATGRYLLQSEQYSDCLAHFARQMPDVRDDRMARRRAVNWACIALASAECGIRELFAEATNFCIRELERDVPCFQLDFVVDAIIRALRRHGHSDQAKSFGRAYCDRRRASYPRPVPVAFVALSAEYQSSHMAQRSAD